MYKFDKIKASLLESKVRVIAASLVIICSIIFCFFFSDIIIKALENKIPYKIDILQLYVPEIFFNNLKIGIFAGLFISAPFLIYQFSKLKIKNISPEKKTTMVLIVSLFFGMSMVASLIAYYIFIPLQLFIFLGINYGLSTLTLNLSNYISFCLATVFFSCLLFYIPIFYYLIKENLFLNYQDLISLKKTMYYVAAGISLLILSPPEIIGFVIFAVIIYLFYMFVAYLTGKYGKKNGL
jgi:sec-independent protein translocase protein TatC